MRPNWPSGASFAKTRTPLESQYDGTVRAGERDYSSIGRQHLAGQVYERTSAQAEQTTACCLDHPYCLRLLKVGDVRFGNFFYRRLHIVKVRQEHFALK